MPECGADHGNHHLRHAHLVTAGGHFHQVASEHDQMTILLAEFAGDRLVFLAISDGLAAFSIRGVHGVGQALNVG